MGLVPIEVEGDYYWKYNIPGDQITCLPVEINACSESSESSN